MPPTFKLSIITPEGAAYEGEVESLTASGEQGSFGVLARHASMIAAIRPGPLGVTAQGETFFFAAGAGIVEVSEGGVMVLADRAEEADSQAEARRLAAEHDPSGARPIV